MKPIAECAISGLNDIVMELPAFRDLKSKDNIKEVLDLFLNDVYINGTEDLYNAFDFKLSPKMQETQFLNYGIEPKYSKRIKGYLKKDLAYRLEVLFQNKGSKVVFKIFNELFKNIFRNLNFYNIIVNKIMNGNDFRFEYSLEPIYINDPSNLIRYPELPVHQLRKYLMELENFKDFTMWPMPTNLVYIQMSMGDDLINNMDTFMDGIRAYGSTYLQGKVINYKSECGFTELIKADDVEFITSYFAVEISKRNMPNSTVNLIGTGGAVLPFEEGILNPDPNNDQGLKDEYALWIETREDFLENMQDLIQDYADMNYADIKESDEIRRRWQLFLNLKTSPRSCYNSYDEMVAKMESEYPNLKHDFLKNLSLAEETELNGQRNNEPLFDFYLYVYSLFLNSVYSSLDDAALGLNKDWVIDYLDTLFGNLFIEADFTKNFFNPVMDLFIRYFFPIEMEYMNDMINKIFIKDGFNTIGTDSSKKEFTITSKKYSLVNAPLVGLDYQGFYLKNKFLSDRIIHQSVSGVQSQVEAHDSNTISDRPIVAPQSFIREPLEYREEYNLYMLDSLSTLSKTPRRAAFTLGGCLKTGITKEHITDVFRLLKSKDEKQNNS